jgi:uncharacterized membrane protein HdeD (DUF308 family)
MVTLLIGTVIIARWPVSSLYILGLFLSIDLIVTGVAWMAVGYGLKQDRPSHLASRFVRSMLRR